jgi:predicted O-linked N-acetylglucosamine transferase (SPINDLY family)
VEYRERAVAFAANSGWLTSLRAGLREALISSPLCDAERFARNLENAFREMVRISTQEREMKIAACPAAQEN